MDKLLKSFVGGLGGINVDLLADIGMGDNGELKLGDGGLTEVDDMGWRNFRLPGVEGELLETAGDNDEGPGSSLIIRSDGSQVFASVIGNFSMMSVLRSSTRWLSLT